MTGKYDYEPGDPPNTDTMRDIRLLEGGLIKLFHRVEGGKVLHTWSAHFKISGHPRYRGWSSGTGIWIEAVPKAYRELLRIKAAFESNSPLKQIRFRDVAQEYLDKLTRELEAGEITDEKKERAGTVVGYLKQSKFWDTLMPKISEVELDEYLLDRKRGKFAIPGGPYKGEHRKPAPATFNIELVHIRAIFKLAYSKKYIHHIPMTKRAGGEKERRYTFSEDEWQLLKSHMEKWETQASMNPKAQPYREILRDFVLFLAASGMRPGEARNVKWEDILSISSNGDGKEYPIIRVTKGKTGPRKIEGVRCLPEIMEPLKRRFQKTSYKNPSDYIFCHPDDSLFKKGGKPISNPEGLFKRLLQEIVLEKDKDGKPTRTMEYDSMGHRRVLYSCRHYYCTQRLKEPNSDIHFIAQNMGTSITQIENHYGHYMISDAPDSLVSTTKREGRQSQSQAILDKLRA